MDNQRHGCFTFLLILTFFGSTVSLLMYFFGSNPTRPTYPNVKYWYFIVNILDIIFVLALWKWKKWGFWGTLIVCVLSFIINLIIGVKILYVFSSASGALILYGVLRLKTNGVRGWDKLK